SYEVTFSAADEAYITSGQTIGACDADWTRILKMEIPNALAFRILNGAKLTCHVTGTLGGGFVYGVVVEDAQAAGETKILALTVSSAAVRQESGAISLTLSIEGGEGLSPEEAVSSDQHFLIAGKISPRPVQEIHVNKSGNIIFYERITQGTLLEPGDHVIGEYDGAYVGDAYYSGAKIGRKIEEAESEIAHLGEVSDQIRGLTREISRLESVPKGAGQTIEQEDLGEISALLDQINGIVLTAPQKSGDALRAAINRLKALAVSLKTVKLHPKGYVARQAKLIAQVIEDQTAAGQVIDFEALSAQVTALVDIDFSRLKDADEIEVALASVETDKKALIRKALEALGATPDQDFARLSQARIEQLNEFLAALREAAGAVPVGITISGEQAVRILELNKEAGEGAPILVHSNGSYFETAVNRQKAAELGLEDGMRVILRTPAGDLEGVLRLEEREGAELAVYVLFPELAGVGGDVPALLGIEAQSLGSLVSSRLRGLPAWKLSLAFAAAALLGACTFPFITKSDLDTVRTEERLDIDNSPITPKKEVSLEKLEVTSDEEGKIFVTEVKESGEKVTRPLEEYVAERNDGIISAKLTLDSAEATEAFFDSIQIVPVLGGNYSFESHKHFGGQFGFLITLGRYGSLTLAGGANSLEGDFQRSLSFIGSIQSLFTQIGPYEDELRHIAARNAGYRHQELIGDEVTQARNILRTSWEWKQQTVYLEAIKTHLETAIRYATEKAALEISGRYWQDQVNFLKEKLGVTESALTEIHHAYGKLALEKEKFGDLLGLHDDIPIDVGDKTGSLDLNRVDTLSIKADNRRGLGETEILQATAGTSSRVGRALDAWTTIACELIIQDRDFLGVYPYIFEGIHIDDSDLTLAIDPNRINWLRRAIRETGLVVKGPDLIQIGKRMFGGAKDEALQPLRDERAAIIRAVQTTEVNKIRRARFNYFAGLNALVDARDGISQAEQSLQEAQGRLTDGHQDAAYDIFLSKVKVEEAQIQFVAARAQYERALDEFQAFLEDLRANLVRAGPVLDGMGDEEQVEVEQEVINGLGQPYIDALEEAAPIPNQWVVGEDVDITNLQRVSAPAAHEGIGARSLGVEASIQQQANNALSELGLSATDARTGLLIPYLGFLTVALASLSPAQKAQFISKLLSKLGDLASSDIPAGNQESPAVVFADEEYLTKAGPEFIQSFVSKRLRLDVFVSARTPEIAAEKIRQFFPAQVPANVHAHAYNSGLPLVQAMNAVLATPELAGTDPVILSNQSALVRKVSSPLHRVIRVIHDANYPAELALELGRKISATGGQGQVMGTERVGKDDFRLLSIPELIDDLFADITGARLREQSA
ncbi:MAG: hypothetical protein HY586_05010, partial [Candidatus Omnitrophica bacterium]|nr:hypothetical protein [Candidatus Omnitrophota bacterium]